MAAKPSKSSILKSYSHDELLELAKQKAQVEAEERLAEFQRQISALSDMVSGTSKAARRPGRPPGRPAKKSSGRPVGRPKKTKAKGVSRKRAKNEKSLAEFLLDVLNKKPKGVPEIMDAIKQKGYKTSSSNPKRLLYLELTKQSKKGTIQSKGRGKYIKK